MPVMGHSQEIPTTGAPTAAVSPAIKAETITFEEAPVLKIFGSASDKTLSKRIIEANQRLAAALESPPPNETKMAVSTNGDDSSFQLIVNGETIFVFQPANAEAAGYSSFQEYRNSVENEMRQFYSTQTEKIRWQKFAKHFFLSFFFILLGVVLFHQLHTLFERLEKSLAEAREHIGPISFLSETFVTSQTMYGIYAILIVVGRILSYLAVFFTTLFVIMSQFATTQRILKNFVASVVQQIVLIFQKVAESVPGVLLALVLAIVLYGAIKFIRVLIRSYSPNKKNAIYFPSHRIPVLRFWATLGAIVILLPLIIAAFFSSQFTPLGVIAIVFAGALAFSIIPLGINGVIGSYLLWTDQISEGQWLQVGATKGEVTSISLFNLTLVPDQGGTIKVPMLYFLFKPYNKKPDTLKAFFRLNIKRSMELKETLEEMTKFLGPKDADFRLLAIHTDAFEFKVLTPKLNSLEYQELCLGFIEQTSLQILSFLEMEE